MPEHDTHTPDMHNPDDEHQQEMMRSDTSIDETIEERIAAARANELPFDELTLAEAISVFVHAPRRTWSALRGVTRPRRNANSDATISVPIVRQTAVSQPVIASVTSGEVAVSDTVSRLGDRTMLQLGLWLMAFLVAWWGAGTMRLNDEASLSVGLSLFVVAAFIWFLGSCAGAWDEIQSWWQARDRWLVPELIARIVVLIIAFVGIFSLFDSMDEPVDAAAHILSLVGRGVVLLGVAVISWVAIDLIFQRVRMQAGKKAMDADVNSASGPQTSQVDLPWYMQIHPVRVLLVIGGATFSVLTWLGTSNNGFQSITFYLWLASIVMWSLALTPNLWGIWNWLKRVRQSVASFHWRAHGLGVLVLVVIMLVGAFLRLRELDTLPPEMTSDHVELLLDGVKVLNGERQIFFANNGGREPFQMYLLAWLSLVPGFGINFETLKALAVIESLLTIPLMVWLGRAVMGPERKRLGWYVGFILAALLAVSYWHLTVTRLALRIILTPLIMSLVMIYFARALRFNQRADYILTGLSLGFGLYMYQAMRMVPIFIVLAVLLAIYLAARNWRDALRYGIHLVVLAFISFIVFLPMFHYSLDQPDQFWRRTTGRILGDDVIEETQPDGTVRLRDASLGERLEAFNQNVPQLMNNVRNALLMFHYRGDSSWINGVPNTPVLATLSGVAFLLGTVAWGVLIVKTRDPALLMVPLAVLIMLLPSALSIAFPRENPSNTRASGALLGVLLMTALSLALMVDRIVKLQHNRLGAVLALGLVGFVVGGSYVDASNVYFNGMGASYEQSTFNYSEVGRIMYGQALSGDVPYGNMFMIASPHWWDHRAVGLEAGIEGIWPNGVYDYDGGDELTRSVDYLPHFMRDAFSRTDRFAFNPTRDMEIFYNESDDETGEQLMAWFPEGRVTYYDNVHERRRFYRYTIPAIGQERLQAFLNENIPVGE